MNIVRVLAVWLILLPVTGFYALATVHPAYSLPQYGGAQLLASGQSSPAGVAVDSRGTVYWVNWASGELVFLRKGDSRPIVLVSGLQNPLGVGVDLAGNVYFTEYLRGTLSVLAAGSGTHTTLLQSLDHPNFLSVDAPGNVFIVLGETCGDKIAKFDRISRSLSVLLTASTPRNTDYGFGSIFIHPSGDLYYTTCRTGTVERLPRGSATSEVLLRGRDLIGGVSGGTPGLSGLRPLGGIAVDVEGNVFFTEYFRDVNIFAKGTAQPMSLATEGSSHYQLTLDEEGNLYYSDSIGGRIWKVPAQLSYTDALLKTLSSKDAVLSSLQRFISDLESYVSKKVSERDVQIRGLQDRVNSLESALKEKDAQIIELQKKVDQMDPQGTPLQTRVNALETTLKEKESQIKTLQTSLTEKDAQISSLQSRISLMQTSEKDKDTEITTLQSRANSLESTIQERDSRITALQANLKDKDTQISTIEKRVSAAESSSREKDAQLNALGTNLREKESQATRLQAMLAEKDNQLGALRQQLDQAQITTYASSGLMVALLAAIVLFSLIARRRTKELS